MTGTALILAAVLATASPQPAAPSVYLPAVAHTMHVQHNATVSGQFAALPDYWPVAYVWLADYWPTSADEQSGYWVLDPAAAPQTQVYEDLSWRIDDVPPGRYCIIVGMDPMARLVVGQDGWAYVYNVRAHGGIDLGTLRLTP